MGKIKIGFIIPKYRGLQTKFNYGLEQNTFFFVSLFRSIPEYDVSYVLVLDNCLEESIASQKELNDDTPLVELKNLDPQLENPLVYDVLIHVETYLPSDFIKSIKRRFSTKFVSILVGIVMWGLMEDIIYNVANRYIGALPLYEAGLIDEHWISPHHAYQKTYVETLTRSSVTIIPYLYEPWFLQKLENIRKKENPDFNPRYNPKSTKSIGVLEPNINLVKTAVIPACIVELLHRKEPTILNQKTVRVYSSDHLRENAAFQHLFNYFEGKSLFTSENRHPIVDILHFDCDLIVSHQHLCELNYLHLDALYYGIPLVHNSAMLKEYGYYYPDFNIKEGTKSLKLALTQHNSNLEQYMESAKNALQTFSTTNIKNIEGFKKIISSLILR